MKHAAYCALLLLLTAAASASHAGNVGVSINIGQPGFYGRIDLGGFPQPRVIYREPIIVDRVSVAAPEIYLRVPSNHRRNWKRYCRDYNACGQRVYFVQDSWYNNDYVPRYRERQGHGQGQGQGNNRHVDSREYENHGHGKDKGHDKEDRGHDHERD
jgi:hypothetical protein